MNKLEDQLKRWKATPLRPLNKDFTNHVITAIQAGPPARKPWMQGVLMRILQLPKPALVAVAAVTLSLVGTSAYAAFQWLAPQVTINQSTVNDEGKREFLANLENCGEMSSAGQRFELVQGSKVSDEQLKKILENTCEYEQTISFAASRWPATPTKDIEAMKAGEWISNYNFYDIATMDPDKWLTLGRVEAVSEDSITISAKSYAQEEGGNAPRFTEQVVTRQAKLSKNAEAWDQGAKVPLQAVKVGDIVNLVTLTKGQLNADKAIEKELPAEVVGLIKTTIDRDFVRKGYMGNPALVGDVSTLSDCHNNAPHKCTMGGQYSYMAEVYAAGGDSPQPQNAKFRRAEEPGLKPHALNGRITKMEGNVVSLQTRGTNQPFTVTLPYDAIVEFNADNKFPDVAVGDLMEVNYAQKDGENPLSIQPGDLFNFVLKIRQLPGGDVQKL